MKFDYCEKCGKWGTVHRSFRGIWECSNCAEFVFITPRSRWWIAHFPPYRRYWYRRRWPRLDKFTFDEARRYADSIRVKKWHITWQSNTASNAGTLRFALSAPPAPAANEEE